MTMETRNHEIDVVLHVPMKSDLLVVDEDEVEGDEEAITTTMTMMSQKKSTLVRLR